MIFLVEAVERRAIDAEQARLPIGLAEAVEIDQEAHDAIAEAMADRLQAGMHHLAKIKRDRLRRVGRHLVFGALVLHRYSAACASSGGGSRQGATAPSASATASPDRNPSSWKPYPVQAPQNQVCRRPWISFRRFCAAKAAVVYRGCSQRY